MSDADNEPERTPDGRYLIIGGRRWRATDPSIPDAFRSELVKELMAARRAVRDGADDAAVAAARARVQDAKVALGERGEPWWEPASESGLADRLASAMRALLWHRDPEKTICPSDAARAVGGAEWRSVLAAAQSVAGRLAEAKVLEVRQGGKTVDLGAVKGPVRLARGSGWPG